MYRRLSVIWCCAMTRSRLSFVIKFAYAIASRVMRRARMMSEDRVLRIRRRFRRLLEGTTNDSEFESLFLLRANSTLAAITAYLISFEKHENGSFTNRYGGYICLPSSCSGSSHRILWRTDEVKISLGQIKKTSSFAMFIPSEEVPRS